MTTNKKGNAPNLKGRGANIRPNNRFESIHLHHELEHVDDEIECDGTTRTIRTRYYPDESKSFVTRNDSPDIYFTYSANPYRGCAHGCSYCYARPTHEYLGLDAGIDFESKILVKLRAAALLRDWLNRPNWICEPIMFSGVTDCYQPAERSFKLTRECLKVAVESKQPLEIITKNALVVRDIDLLADMAAENLVRVAISITSVNQELTKRLEPRTSSPEARLHAIRQLADAGVPTSVMVAPVIPALNDSEIPTILKRAAEMGAIGAGFVLLRLPTTVEPVFIDWLERFEPLQMKKVISRVRQTRGGEMNDSDYSQRMRGTGAIAQQIGATFKVFQQKYGLNQTVQLDCSRFRPPVPSSGQRRLF